MTQKPSKTAGPACVHPHIQHISKLTAFCLKCKKSFQLSQNWSSCYVDAREPRLNTFKLKG